MRRVIRLVHSAMAMAALTWEPSVAQEGREFRVWNARCEADLSCRAETRPVGGARADYRFRLTRQRDEATWNIVLSTVVARPGFPYEVYATIDGGSFAFDREDTIGAYGQASDLYLLGAEAQRLMEALGPGNEIWFEFLESSGDMHDPRFSLSGLSAALLWIDEKQGRVGSQRQAGNPPKGLTPVDNSGDDQVTLPPDLIEFHRAQKDCDALEHNPYRTLSRSIDLGDGNMLYLVPCEGGAYNATFAAYRRNALGYFRASFATYSDETSWTVSGHLYNPEWNDEARTLTSFFKGRGIADCGSLTIWQLRDGYLRLEKLHHKQECDGEGDPGDFPLVYQAKELPPH